MQENAASSSSSQQPKKKRAQDPPMPPDAGLKPIQLQRRRVWRACENCRRKKIKCDGTEPVCSQCTSSGAQCTWLQTKDRAALSRHYVQELEARLMHMEEIFKQVAPIVEIIEQAPDGGNVPIQGIMEVLQKQNGSSHRELHTSSPPIPYVKRERAPSSEKSNSPAPRSPSTRSSKEEDEISDSFGQLALDEHGHLRWIGGSSTMSLIQSFRALTTSPLNRVSPMEEDHQSNAPSVNKLYFPASVFFGKVHALPGPEQAEYPDRDLADKLVDAYFKRLHFLLPIVDKTSFLKNYTHLMDNKENIEYTRMRVPFIAVVFAVFACAARIVDDPRLSVPDDGALGMVYYERALVLQYISHASIQIAHVQCIVLCASFLCAVNCLPQAWLLVGQAVRMAQDLGLHRHSGHVSMKPIEKQLRRKIFWCVYSLDRMLAMALGRPLGIEDSDCDADYPAEYDDDELFDYFSGANMQKPQPSLMVGFIALVRLYTIAGRLCRQIYGIDKCRDQLEPEVIQQTVEQAKQLDSELVEWCNELPNTFKSTPTTEEQVTMGAVLCSHYYSILTTLHRNFLPITQSNYTGHASSLKAVHSARSCIRLAPSVKNVVPSSHHLALFIQHLFSSAVIILLYAMHIPDKEAANAAMLEAESCMGVVSAWEGIWPGAKKCRELLGDLASTARDAINRGPVQNNMQPASPPFVSGSPSSPPRSAHLARSLSGRVMKNKHSRGKSRDSLRDPRDRERTRSLSVQRSRSSAPGLAGVSRRATSQRRTLEDYDRNDNSGLVSPLRQSFHQPFPPNYEAPEPTSPISEVHEGIPEHGHERQVSFASVSPSIGSAPADSNNNVNYPYSLPEAAMNWNNGGDQNSMFGNGSTQGQGDNASAYSFDGQNFLDPTFMNFDSPMNLQQQPSQGSDTSTLTTSFDTSGLPFHALDVIRNYTPGVFDQQQDNMGLWQGFDGGEFRYDPELQFSLGDLAMDTTNHQG